jgi:hypothetical protein
MYGGISQWSDLSNDLTYWEVGEYTSEPFIPSQPTPLCSEQLARSENLCTLCHSSRVSPILTLITSIRHKYMISVGHSMGTSLKKAGMVAQPRSTPPSSLNHSESPATLPRSLEQKHRQYVIISTVQFSIIRKYEPTKSRPSLKCTTCHHSLRVWSTYTEFIDRNIQ